MERLRLFKYPGSKLAVVDAIAELYRKSGASLFVDVFGGSGSVSLNVDVNSVVYNDIDPDLVNIFRAIQRDRNNVIYTRMGDLLGRGWNKSGQESAKPSRRYGREKNRNVMERIEGMKLAAEKDPHDGDIESAFLSICRMSTSFGGRGSGYVSEKEKSPYRYLERTFRQYPYIRGRIVGWKVESMDFRLLLKKYDSPGAFFFLDPPYSSDRWYSRSFRKEDFLDLLVTLKCLSGRYALVLDRKRSGYEIGDFGSRIITLETARSRRQEPVRLIHIYTNVP